MFGLYSDDEVNYIFSNSSDGVKGISSRAYELHNKRPGFFTPYKNGSHAVGGVVAPIIYPVFGAVLAGYSLFFAAIASVVCVGSLLTAAGAYCLKNTSLYNEAQLTAGWALEFIGVTLLTAAMSTLLTVLCIPYNLAKLATRSAATLAAGITGYSDAYIEPEEFKEPSCTLDFF